MNNKIKLDYTSTSRAIEVDGEEYIIPERTKALDALLSEHNEKINDRTEYESNFDMLCILFGKENAEKMFPEDENTNLDKLSKCVRIAMTLFMADYYAIQEEKLKENLDKLKPAMNVLDKTTKAIDKANTANFVAGKRQK